MKMFSVALATMFAIAAAPASSATLAYKLTGYDVDGTVEYASFRLNSKPVPLPGNVGLGDGFRLKFISGVFQYGSIVSNLQDLEFFNTNVGGGFYNLEPTDMDGSTKFLSVLGDQLYSGSEAAPMLLEGNYTVYDEFSGAELALSVAAVPEPATWAMMIVGLGATGCVVRRRRGAVNRLGALSKDLTS